MRRFLNSAREKLVEGADGPASGSGTLSGHNLSVGGRQVHVEQRLGVGGFATVYSCRDVSTGEQFALKQLCFGGNEEALELAQREAETMERLGDHPHIVKLVGHSLPADARGDGYLLLEKCTGTLASLLEGRGERLDDALALTVFCEVSSAVCHMHGAQPPVAHRDLKVENVLRGADGKWKLCDFGSATERAKVYATEAERLGEEEVIQKQTTPSYRAPEMWDLFMRQRVDEKVDVWAMGCLLFRLVYGTLAFDGESKLQVLNGNYRVPAGLTPAPNANILKLVKAAFVPDPAARPAMARLHQASANVGQALGATCAPIYPPPPPKAQPAAAGAGFEAEWDAFGTGGGGGGGGEAAPARASSKAAFWDAVESGGGGRGDGGDGDGESESEGGSEGAQATEELRPQPPAQAGTVTKAARALEPAFEASVGGEAGQHGGEQAASPEPAAAAATASPQPSSQPSSRPTSRPHSRQPSHGRAGSFGGIGPAESGPQSPTEAAAAARPPTAVEAEVELAAARVRIAELEAIVSSQAAEIEQLKGANAVVEDPFGAPSPQMSPPAGSKGATGAARQSVLARSPAPPKPSVVLDPFATLGF